MNASYSQPLFHSHADHYENLSSEFSKYHTSMLNIGLHFITTPMGVVGFFSLIRSYTKSSSAMLTLTAVYLLSLLPILPSGEFIGTAAICGTIVAIARYLELKWWMAIAAITFGYLLQDLAHLGTGELTFQSTYSAGGQVDLANPLSWLQQLADHTYYLLPLCVHVALPYISVPHEIKAILEAPLPTSMQQLHAFAGLLGPLVCCALGSYCLDTKNSFCFFPGAPYFYRVLQCSLLNTEDPDGDKHKSHKEDLEIVRKWTMAHDPDEDKSSHWWYKDLNGEAKTAFDNVSSSSQITKMFRTLFSETHYYLDTIDGMNEIYVSGPAREEEAANSDHVFYSRHVDAPFGFVPFVSVYRCIVGTDKNMLITTHFPLAHMGVNACEGDVLAFDFNREVHYITRDDSNKDISDKFRVTLKLHYCIYPRVLAPLGWLMTFLNTRYNMSFRALFLKTIKPASLYEHFLAWNVNFNTFLFDRIETLLGLRNLAYIIFVLALWRATGVYEVFFSLTSFIHYFRYISTFYVRKDIDFGSFKRDVLLFKSLALVQLFYHYLFPSSSSFMFDPLSVFMIMLGYALSVMATNAIGIDRTYFAAELGLVEPKWIDKFPYGYIPHPMIVSQVVALLGFYKAEHFRREWPYAIPIHITLYLIHMMQEQFDVYQKPTHVKMKAV